ncbi:hypothetical protein N9O56_00840 [Rickettsiales bacterium]|nr:hypothetical protein [Rickettsiales bacterium]
MFRFLSVLILVILILIPIIWLFNNNGSIVITWLGYQVKINILVFAIAFSLFLSFLFIVYRSFYGLISVLLKFCGIFKVNQVKKRDKVIEKNDKALSLISQYLSAFNNGSKNEANNLKNKINSLIKNKELKSALVEHISKIDLLKQGEGEGSGVKKSKLVDFLKKST